MNETTSVGSTSEARELPHPILADATYSVIVTHDGKHATSVTGWQNLIDLVRREFYEDGDISGHEEYWAMLLDHLHDPSHWANDDQGPWRWVTDYADSEMIIYRHWIGNLF